IQLDFSRGAAAVVSQGRKPLGVVVERLLSPGGAKVLSPLRGFRIKPLRSRDSRPWLTTAAAPRLNAQRPQRDGDKPMNRSYIRPVLYVLGVLVLVGTLVGARFLAPGAGGGTDATDPVKSRMQESAAPAKAGSGPVVIGFVDSNPTMVQYGLP